MTGRRRALAIAAAVWGAGVLRHPDARAEVMLQVLPTLAAGVTTNAELVVNGSRDEFATLSTLVRVQARAPRAIATLGTRLSLWHYFQGRGSDSGSAELLGTATFNLTSALDLHLTASGALSRTSQIGTLALVTPQATASGASVYLSTNAAEELVWQPTTGWRLWQSALFSRVGYPFDAPGPGRRPTTTVGGGGRVEYIRPRDTFSLDARATEFFLGPGVAVGGAPIAADSSLLAQALLGWRRELSLLWSTDIEAGAAYLSNGAGADVYTPAGRALLAYRRLTWFATLEFSQLPVANMLTALATVNDQAYLRLTLPLSERELATISGFAGVIYARAADASGTLSRAYDQQSVGAHFSMLIGRLPLSGAVDYTFVNQNGGPGVGAPIADLVRHTVMVSVTGVMAFGPGTPPLLDSGRLVFSEH